MGRTADAISQGLAFLCKMRSLSNGKAPMEPMKPSRRATASVIAETLRSEIVHGDFPPGVPLRQDHIAERFGVSHIPVREALKQLAGEGLCVAQHNRGYVVSGLSPIVARELTEYRALLESQLVRWAVPNLTKGTIGRAAGLLDRIDETSDVNTTLALNVEFHNVIYKCAERPFFLTSVENVRANLNRYWRLAWDRLGYKPHSQKEHRRFLKLCAKGDADAAAAFVDKHIRDTGEQIIRYLMKSESE